MASWVHCNKCFLRLQKGTPNVFYITECGHVVCEKCSKEISISDNCIICNDPTKLLRLSKDMDPTLQKYFCPIDDQIMKSLEEAAVKLSRSMARISNFQNTQRDSLLLNMQRKYEYAKVQYMKQCSISKKLMLEIKPLRDMAKRYSTRPTSTPTLCKDTSFPNLSASTITPDRNSRFFKNDKNTSSLFTPMKQRPGVAHRMVVTDISNQSSVSLGISPAQTVPAGGSKFAAPVHGPAMMNMPFGSTFRKFPNY